MHKGNDMIASPIGVEDGHSIDTRFEEDDHDMSPLLPAPSHENINNVLRGRRRRRRRQRKSNKKTCAGWNSQQKENTKESERPKEKPKEQEGPRKSKPPKEPEGPREPEPPKKSEGPREPKPPKEPESPKIPEPPKKSESIKAKLKEPEPPKEPEKPRELVPPKEKPKELLRRRELEKPKELGKPNKPGQPARALSSRSLVLDIYPNDREALPSNAKKRRNFRDVVNKEWVFIITNLIVEILLLVLDQLGSPQNPNYSLAVLVVSIVAIAVSLLEPYLEVRKNGFTFKRNRFWFQFRFHHPSSSSSATHEQFNMFTYVFGFICALSQFILFAIAYSYHRRHVDSPINISIVSLVFILCLAFSKLTNHFPRRRTPESTR